MTTHPPSCHHHCHRPLPRPHITQVNLLHFSTFLKSSVRSFVCPPPSVIHRMLMPLPLVITMWWSTLSCQLPPTFASPIASWLVSIYPSVDGGFWGHHLPLLPPNQQTRPTTPRCHSNMHFRDPCIHHHPCAGHVWVGWHGGGVGERGCCCLEWFLPRWIVIGWFCCRVYAKSGTNV